MTFLLLLGLLIPAITYTQEAQPDQSAAITNFIEGLTLEQTLYILSVEQHMLAMEKMHLPFCRLRNAIEAEMYDPEFGRGLCREQFLHLWYNLLGYRVAREMNTENITSDMRSFFDSLPRTHELEKMACELSHLETPSFTKLYLAKKAQTALVAFAQQYNMREKLSYLLRGYITQCYKKHVALGEDIDLLFKRTGCSFFAHHSEAYAQFYNRAARLIAEQGTQAQRGLLEIIYTPAEHATAVTENETFAK